MQYDLAAVVAGNESQAGTVRAIEFDGGSVTSPGFEDFLNFVPPEMANAGFLASNPGMVMYQTLSLWAS